MDYKERYEKALEKAREYNNVYKDHTMMSYAKGALEDIFPELKESEDEKIRKSLIHLVHLYGGEFGMIDANTSVEKAIAWLEKQEGCEYIKKDWLEHIKQSWYKEGFIDGKYSGGTSKEWTINDAATLKELIDFLENGTAKLQHDLTRYANWLKNQFTPIEKQGEQNFEMKTAEESLGIDSDTYNKIVDECIFGEQKPEENNVNIGGISPNWSEEDERLCQCLIEDQKETLDKVRNNKYGHSEIISDLKEMYHERIDWLKSLKQRIMKGE